MAHVVHARILMRKLAMLLVLATALTAAADEYEQLMLPVSPSIVHCALESRYETRLLAYNDDDRAAGRLCPDGRCREMQPQTGAEFTGEYVGGLPLPMFIYLPKAIANKMRMSLVVESSERSRPEERSYTELPIVRTSDFREGKIQLIGVRMDPDFRQTVRTFGLDGRSAGEIMMRVYDLHSGELLHSCLHYVGPLGDTAEMSAEGRPLRPAFGMECNMSDHLQANGERVRIELEPLTPGLKYWAFVSVTNNTTQHFYTVLPQ